MSSEEIFPRLLAEKAKIEAALKYHELQMAACTGALQLIASLLAESPPGSTGEQLSTSTQSDAQA